MTGNLVGVIRGPGHYLKNVEKSKNTYNVPTGGGLLMPFKVAKFMHYIIDIPL